MKRLFSAACVVVVFLFSSSGAHSNPFPSFETQMYPVIWLIRTLPFNYALDLASLCLALLIFRQTQSIPWKMLPIYNLIVVVAGYASDLGARAITQYPAYSPSVRDPILGVMVAGQGSEEYTLRYFTFLAGTEFIATAALLIFLFNLAIIYYIIRTFEIEHRGMLPLAAAVVAVITSPYVGLRGEAKAAWFVPILLLALGVGASYLIRQVKDRQKPDKGFQKSL
jgi:hypothetical protein